MNRDTKSIQLQIQIHSDKYLLITATTKLALDTVTVRYRYIWLERDFTDSYFKIEIH